MSTEVALPTTEDHRVQSIIISCTTSEATTTVPRHLLPEEEAFPPEVFSGLEKAEWSFRNLPNDADDDL